MARKIDGPLATLIGVGAVLVIDGKPYLRVASVETDGTDKIVAFPMSEVTAITNTQVFNYMTNLDPVAAKRAKLEAEATKAGFVLAPIAQGPNAAENPQEPTPKEV